MPVAYTVIWTLKDEVTFSQEDPVEVDQDGVLRAFAPDPITMSVYQFQIKCQAEGGAEITTTALKTLEINCDETYFNTYIHQYGESALSERISLYQYDSNDG